MTTLILVRHAETEATGRFLTGRQLGHPLNGCGKAQARELARILSPVPLQAIFTSPLERAVQTARCIAATHCLQPETVNELGELNVGEWEGRSFAELEACEDWRRFNTYRSGARPPGGESMLEARGERV